MGGELVVRDYPDDVSPRENPDWPGYRGLSRGTPRHDRAPERRGRPLLSEWRVRRAEQDVDKARMDRFMAGPCARPEPETKTTKPKKKKRNR